MPQTQNELQEHYFEGDISLFYDPNRGGYLMFFQDAAPTESAAPNAVWVDTDATGNNRFMINTGTATTPVWSSTEATVYDDSEPLYLGSSNDAALQWDGTQLTLIPLADNSAFHIGNALGTLNFDVIWYSTTAAANVTFDQSGDIVIFDGVDLQLKDEDATIWGDGPDIEAQWNGTYMQSGQANSTKMWYGCPSALDPDPTNGFYWLVDNRECGVVADSWDVTTDAGGALTYLSEDNGWVQAITDGDQHDETYAVYGNGNIASFAITASSSKKRWASVKGIWQGQATISGFIGWAKGADSAADFLVDTTGVLLSTADAIGLVVRASTPTAVDLAYIATGETEQEQVGVAVNAADNTTAVRLDLYFDGATTIKVWVDGVAKTDITIGATFPDAVPLMPFIGVKTNATATRFVKADYWVMAGQR